MDKAINLSAGGHAIVSDEDFGRVCLYKWSKNGCGYVQAWIGGRPVLMHRYLLGAQPGQEVDHINRDKLDNRRDNLRFSNRQANMLNKAVQSRSGYKGVDRTSKNRWRARIKCDGKTVYLGVYQTAEAAARAYDTAAKSIFGPLASLNFSPGTIS